jgi:glycosyltransferase involved in cell wall biosynthesis
MAARNCEQYVGQAIESVLKQSFADWELLVGDDGSDDRTREVIDGYSDSRIRRFHQNEKVGFVGTRNKLIEQARGEYLIWQDADDWSDPSRFERLVREMDARPELVACGSYVVKVGWRGRDRCYLRYPLEHDEILAEAEKKHRFPVIGASRIVRSDAIRIIGGLREFFEGRGAEDIDLGLRLSEIGRVGNVGEYLYFWRYRRGSSSRQILPEDPLREFSSEIAFFLWEQRLRNGGLDGLMPGGNKEEFEGFLAQLMERARRDPALPYRRAFRNAIVNRDYELAIALWPRILKHGGVRISLARDLGYWLISLLLFQARRASRMVRRRICVHPYPQDNQGRETV